MKSVLGLTIAVCLALLAAAQEPTLTPLDFGFGMLEHGRVDYCNPPPQTLAGNFNSDDYLDIARFDGNQLDIFISTSYGYTPEPQQVKTFDKPIISLGFGGTIWDTHPPLKVIFTDGTEELFYLRRGMLDLDGEVLPSPSPHPPRTISEADFQIVWESEEYPYGLNECTVGDVDNDGYDEFATFFSEDSFWDTSHVIIYESIGENQYNLFVDEPFLETIAGNFPTPTFFLVTDIDQDDNNELMFTYDGCYFWDISTTGEIVKWKSNFVFPRAVRDVKVSDIDQDGVLELSVVMYNSDLTPPCAYYVCEFDYKDEVTHTINFNIMTGFWQNWSDARLAVGDFDNDGVVDIVSGNFGAVWWSDPVDVQFYRYNPGSSTEFDQCWLETGLPIRCANPIIADIDCDGDLDLYVGGYDCNSGAAFLWEGNGLYNGYASWVDSTSAPGNIDFSSLGEVDGAPAVVASYTPSSTTSILSIWSFQDGGFHYAWESPLLEQSDYRWPHLADMDNDGKMSIMVVDDKDKVIDWEQTSTGIHFSPDQSHPETFQLFSIHPNPFNNSTALSFYLPFPIEVSVSVFDICGRRQSHRIIPFETSGEKSIVWNAKDLTSGLYFFRIKAGSDVKTLKAILIK